MYLQSKAIYKLANGDFIEIFLCGGRGSFYCNATLGRQFLALQNTFASSGKKSWPTHEEWFFKRTEFIVERDLEEPEVV